jgi:hypothetical protein
MATSHVSDATADFERWLASFTELDQTDLDFKHQQMAKKRNPFPFFRATFYRWLQLWPEVCRELADAPRVLAIGDLHVENFGTWRDAEGRLVWGVNDFDEAAPLAYANDLVRLAASTILAVGDGTFHLSARQSCEALLNGYVAGLKKGGRPFVLDEKHAVLRTLAVSRLRDSVHFWAKLRRLIDEPPARVPDEARGTLLELLPDPALPFQVRRRRQAGLGSLGKPRFVALAKWRGGLIAREVKALTPPAVYWVAAERASVQESMYGQIVTAGVRCPDPFLRLKGGWVFRRLAPDCARIDLASLTCVRDVHGLLKAMGRETANMHLGTEGAADAILTDLAARPADWLPTAAKAMARATVRDWKQWKRDGAKS